MIDFIEEFIIGVHNFIDNNFVFFSFHALNPKLIILLFFQFSIRIYFFLLFETICK